MSELEDLRAELKESKEWNVEYRKQIADLEGDIEGLHSALDSAQEYVYMYQDLCE